MGCPKKCRLWMICPETLRSLREEGWWCLIIMPEHETSLPSPCLPPVQLSALSPFRSFSAGREGRSGYRLSMLYDAVLWCHVLCCAVPGCAVLCCVVLCCVQLHSAVLCCSYTTRVIIVSIIVILILILVIVSIGIILFFITTIIISIVVL